MGSPCKRAGRRLSRAFLAVSFWAASRSASAGEPIPIGPLQLTLGGEASGSIAGRDTDYFNQGDYGLSLLRLFRAGVSAELAAGPHLAILGEVRSDNLQRPRVYALYVRVRPWEKRAFDVQAGLIPPVFGGFPRHGYANDPALIGYPLAYHYATLIRSDSAPLGVEDLQRWRGRGGWVSYPTGTRSYDHGLPLVAAYRWDTGVQAQLVTGPWELSAAVTQGTLGHPLVKDDNSSKQVSARAAWRAPFGLTGGVSAARGGYVSREVLETLPGAGRRDFHQRAAGVDVEYARGHWILRGEGVWSGWDAVAESPALFGRTLAARGVSLEGRYRAWPGVTVATRLERLDFGDLPGGSTSWDAPVSRVELGAGYAVRRNLSVKLAYQSNRRDGGRLGRRNVVAIQGVAWF